MKPAVLVLMLALVVAGCGGSKKAAKTTTRSSVVTHGRYHYSDAVVTSYMSSCTGGQASRRAYCACTLDRLSNDVSTRDFERIGSSGGQVPARINRLMKSAVAACRDKI